MVVLGRLDVTAVAIVCAAFVAWLFGVGWWTTVVGTVLVGFGPGYLLLRGAAHTLRTRVARAGLYVASSLAISAAIGLAIETAEIPLSYSSIAAAYMLVVVPLFLAQEFATRLTSKGGRQGQQFEIRLTTIIRGSLFVALPFVASVLLLASSPARSPASTELSITPVGEQAHPLPAKADLGDPVEVRVIAYLAAPASGHTLDITANDRLVHSWEVPAGSTEFDRIFSVDASQFRSDTVRLEARLAAPGQREYAVWLSVARGGTD